MTTSLCNLKVRKLALSLAALAVTCSTTAARAESPKLDVKSWIQSPRILYTRFNSDPALSWSPDRSRFVLFAIHGDLGRDGNWINIYSGDAKTVRRSKGLLQPTATLFTDDYRWIPLRSAGFRWLSDNRRIAFIWNESDRSKILIVDLVSGKISEAVNAAGEITNFDISNDGRTVAYVLREIAPMKSKKFSQMLHDGFAVSDAATGIDTLLRGFPDDEALGFYAKSLFIAHDGISVSAQVDLRTWSGNNPYLSPNGDYVAIWAPPGIGPLDWGSYKDKFVQELVSNPRWPGQGAYDRTVGQIWIVDSKTGRARLAMSSPSTAGVHVSWRPDSAEFVAWPTFLPGSSDAATTGFAIARVDVKTLSASEIAAPGQAAAVPKLKLKYDPDGQLTSGSDHGSEILVGKSWVDRAQSTVGSEPAFVRLIQGPNIPPRLETASGSRILQFDNEEEHSREIGRTMAVSWRDGKGRAWSGRLYLPIGFKSGERVPLVLSTVPKAGLSTDQFSMSGNEAAVTPIGIGQLLANRGIAMLVMGQPDDPAERKLGTTDERAIVLDGFLSAIQDLSAKGITDPSRVGLAGFSRTGSYVEYAVSHSRFPFAAALAADNVDHGYFQAMMNSSPFAAAEFEHENGAPPVGDGLLEWLRLAPGFNADKVHTPLKLERDSGGLVAILSSWEMFSQLRRMSRPVELYLIPDVEHGAHGLERPSQQLASLAGSLDWFDFWLKGYEDRNPNKRQQYARWEHLCDLQRSTDPSQPTSCISSGQH